MSSKIAAILIVALSTVLPEGAAAEKPDEVEKGRSSSSANSTNESRQPAKGMVWIPPGEFTMGCDAKYAHPNESPTHRVRLDGFWMDEHAVTNAEFQKFVSATGYKTIAERPVDWEEIKKQSPPGTPRPPDEMLKPGSLVFTPPGHRVDTRDLANWWSWTTGANWQHPQGSVSNIDGLDDVPVVHVAWDDAVAYCRWAGKTLPTEAQWEYAARGGLDGKRFPWGDEFRPGGKFMANTYTGEFPIKDTSEDGYSRPAPVRSFPPNGYGLYDMGGNVWNWTADLYRADAHEVAADELKRTGASCCTNPRGPSEAFNPTRPVIDVPERVIKGGSFLCNVSYCESYRPSARRGTPPDTGSEHVGFRCAKAGD